MKKCKEKKCQEPKVLNQDTQIRIKLEVDLHLMKALIIKQNLPIKKNSMNRRCMNTNKSNSNKIKTIKFSL